MAARILALTIAPLKCPHIILCASGYDRDRNRKLEISTAPIKAESREPAY